MPRGAEVTLVDVQRDPRFQLLHICRPTCLLLGAKNRLWSAVRPPMRSKGEGPVLALPSSCTPGWAVPSAHVSYFGGKWASSMPNRGAAPVLLRCGPKGPRRAMIRRRGKRGRIWRAGTTEAYENRTQLTNDARSPRVPRNETIGRITRVRHDRMRAESFRISGQSRNLGLPWLGLASH